MTPEVAAYLKAYNGASPEEKAAINAHIVSQGVPGAAARPEVQQAPPPNTQSAASPAASGDATPNSQSGLLDDGQGGFIPAPGSNYPNYGIVSNHNGVIVLNTPQGQMSFSNPADAQRTAQQLGIPYAPALPIVGTATPDQLNGFTYGINSDGTPSNAQQQQAYIAGMQGDGSKKDDGTGTAAQKDAQAQLKQILTRYGLGSMVDWAWQQIIAGSTPTQILQALRDRPEWHARFAGIDQRQQNGLSPMSEEEYIASESQIADYLQRAGLPKNFYDTPDDFAKLIGSFANVSQVADRVQKGFMQVTQAAPEVRQEFARWFGVQGDAALAAYFLDPTMAEPALEKMAAQAKIGGSGLRQGLDVTQQMAGSIADMGMSDQQIQVGMGQAGTMSGLQQQTLNEASAKAAGLSADQIAGGVFNSDEASNHALKQKLDSRQSEFATKGGALSSVSAGAVGLG